MGFSRRAEKTGRDRTSHLARFQVRLAMSTTSCNVGHPGSPRPLDVGADARRHSDCIRQSSAHWTTRSGRGWVLVEKSQVPFGGGKGVVSRRSSR